MVVPNGTAEDSLTTEDTQNGDEIDRTYLFNGAAVGSAVLEVTQAQDTASVQEGEQNMQAAQRIFGGTHLHSLLCDCRSFPYSSYFLYLENC